MRIKVNHCELVCVVDTSERCQFALMTPKEYRHMVKYTASEKLELLRAPDTCVFTAHS